MLSRDDAVKLAACVSTVGGNGFARLELLREVRQAFPEIDWRTDLVGDVHVGEPAQPKTAMAA